MKSKQRRREGGTSGVAFEVLIMNFETDFMNLFIFNYLMSTINLFILNYLTSNINLFIFNSTTLNINLFILNCLTLNFLFSEKHIFCKEKRTAIYGRLSAVSDFKLTRKNDDLLSLRHK